MQKGGSPPTPTKARAISPPLLRASSKPRLLGLRGGSPLDLQIHSRGGRVTPKPSLRPQFPSWPKSPAFTHRSRSRSRRWASGPLPRSCTTWRGRDASARVEEEMEADEERDPELEPARSQLRRPSCLRPNRHVAGQSGRGAGHHGTASPGVSEDCRTPAAANQERLRPSGHAHTPLREAAGPGWWRHIHTRGARA